MDVGAVFEQETHDVEMPVHRCVTQTNVVAGTYIGTEFKQEPNDLDVSLVRGDA